jgi:hypothetical protein
VPAVDHPPHAKPIMIVTIAPQIRPQIPYLILPAFSGFIDIILLYLYLK